MDQQANLSEIGQIAITVSDVEAALAFYRDVLGLRFLLRPVPDLAFLAAGPVRLMLTTPQGAGAVGANSILYFRVDDITSTHAAIVARGARNERPPQLAARLPDHELWLAFVRDPDGNLVGLMEERRAAGRGMGAGSPGAHRSASTS
jgi:catechol 2,3-dioxygenase-like lactoylglutathione lyase family enzyme